MDMPDCEDNYLDSEDYLELVATYGDVGSAGGAPDNGVADVAPRASALLASSGDDVDESTVAAISAGLEEAGEALELNPVAQVELQGANNASAGSAEQPPAEAPHEEVSAPPLPDWQRMVGPSSSGYVYLDGRAVMRIQRGRPAGRLTLSCYRHTGCSMLINIDRAPTDDELKKWFFEVEPNAPESKKEERKEMTKTHLSLARARWTSKR